MNTARTLAQQLDIADITDGLVVLRDGSYAMILETTSVNLDLKSEAEADVLIAHYQHLLQSLTTPIQIIVKNRPVQMDEEYARLQKKIDLAEAPVQKQLLEDYREFLAQLVVGRNMLTRRFFMVLRTTTKTPLDQAKEQLQTQREQLLRLLQPMEIKAVQLSNLSIATLFYDSFQPGKAEIQPLVEEIWV